jgi:hypothetical protein
MQITEENYADVSYEMAHDTCRECRGLLESALIAFKRTPADEVGTYGDDCFGKVAYRPSN